MADTALAPHTVDAPSMPRRGFYQRVLRALLRRDVPCLLGGTYALEAYTGIRRATKDLDLFIYRADWPRVVDALAQDGIATEFTYPHWLGKASQGRNYVDLLFGSGNGLCAVDEEWFANAREMRIWRVPVLTCPPEELIWSKSFVQERERYDGADVIHLLRAQAATLNWARLVERYGPHWEVLLSFIVLFGFVFPDDRNRIPAEIRDHLMRRFESARPAMPKGYCGGTLFSREQYLVDIEERGNLDARLRPLGTLTKADLAPWTAEVPASRRATMTRGRFTSDE